MAEDRIAVLTDSGTVVPEEFVAEYDVRVLPLQIVFGNEQLRSGVDITPEELVARIDEHPSTSLPSLTDIKAAIERARDEGFTGAVFAGIASGLSGTCQAVRVVAEQIPDFPVIVADTKSIGVAAGMVVMAAARKAKEGISLAKLGDYLADLAENTRVWFSVPELSHLRRGGRINEATYRLGSLLKICPVITCEVPGDGHYVTVKKPRGFEHAMHALVDLAVKQAAKYESVRLAICCSAPEKGRFDALEEALRSRVSARIVEVVRSAVSADLLVHTGPSLVGVAVQEA